MRGWRMGAAVWEVLLLLAVALGGGSGVAAATGNRQISLVRLTGGPVGLPARPAAVLMPFVRTVQPIVGVPSHSGLVARTKGNVGLGHPVVGFGKLWVTRQPWRVVNDYYEDLRASVLTLDLRTRRPIGRPIPAGRGAYGIAVGAGSVWVTNSADATVTRIDPTSRRVMATIVLGRRNLARLAVSHGTVWVLRDDYDTSKRGGELIRIDPRTNQVVGRTVLGKNVCGSFGLAVTRDAVWITADAQGDVIRIDPTNGRVVARIHMNGAPIAPIVAQGLVWVANESDGSPRLWRIDPATNHVTDVPKFHGWGWMLQPSGGKFWTSDGQMIRVVDPVADTVELSIAQRNTHDITVTGTTLWGVSWNSNGSAALRWVDLDAPLLTLVPTPSRVE